MRNQNRKPSLAMNTIRPELDDKSVFRYLVETVECPEKQEVYRVTKGNVRNDHFTSRSPNYTEKSWERT